VPIEPVEDIPGIAIGVKRLKFRRVEKAIAIYGVQGQEIPDRFRPVPKLMLAVGVAKDP
jgi:hypothetical protein